MAVNSETEINLKTLQRVDSNIVEIVDNASQVAIYKYERKLNKWEGTDIEGTLFLYRRSLYPFHGFIIVNRMSTTNFIEPITSDMEFLLQEPYFLYRKHCGDIIGSWFYEDRDFRRITNKIQSIVLKQSSPPRRKRSSSDSDSRLQKDENVQDIMTLLSEAHNDYKMEVNDMVAENNIKEDYNNLSTYTDKEINNKYQNTSQEKPKTPLRSNSEEKYPISPRRRFLSTGSYDSAYSSSHASIKIINSPLINSPKLNVSLGNVKGMACDEICSSYTGLYSVVPENTETPIAAIRMSPYISKDETLPSTIHDVSMLEQPFGSYEVLSSVKSVSPSIISKDNEGGFMTKVKNEVNKIDCDLHTPVLKQTLFSHLKDDSEIMLKIHEAYVASLKSIFTLKS